MWYNNILPLVTKLWEMEIINWIVGAFGDIPSSLFVYNTLTKYFEVFICLCEHYNRTVQLVERTSKTQQELRSQVSW